MTEAKRSMPRAKRGMPKAKRSRLLIATVVMSAVALRLGLRSTGHRPRPAASRGSRSPPGIGPAHDGLARDDLVSARHQPGGHADKPSSPAVPAVQWASQLESGPWPTAHVQGIAVDLEHGFVYYSFTTLLVKTDHTGEVIGTVTGFTGHLGDLDFNPEDGRVYGSLEYKDAEAFYIAIFDVDRIDRLGMDASDSAVVSTVYLPEVVDDFTAISTATVSSPAIARTPTTTATAAAASTEWRSARPSGRRTDRPT